jgi:hypothetical protein
VLALVDVLHINGELEWRSLLVLLQQRNEKKNEGMSQRQRRPRRKKLAPKWLEWMKQIIEGGRVGIKINGEPGDFFNTQKGLRQGDPLSPLLFNLVSDALATMIDNARRAGEIKGLVPHLIEGGITHLQYADDTIIFVDMDNQSIINIKFLLYCFENMSGLKINYEKSEIFALGCSEEEGRRIAEMLNCNIGRFPMKYLGVMADNKHMTVSDLSYIYQKVEKRVPTWQSWGCPREEK